MPLEDAMGLQCANAGAHGAQALPLANITPHLRTQHGGRFHQHQAAQRRVGASLQHGVDGRQKRVPGCAAAGHGCGLRVGGLLHQLRVHLLGHGGKQAFLVAIVVVQRAHGHTGIGANGAHRRLLITLRAEPTQCGQLQCGLGVGGVFLAAVALGGDVCHGEKGQLMPKNCSATIKHFTNIT